MKKGNITILSSLGIVALLLGGVGICATRTATIKNSGSVGIHIDSEREDIIVSKGSNDEEPYLFLDDDKISIVGSLSCKYVGEENVNRYYTIELSSELTKYIQVSKEESFIWKDGESVNPKFEYIEGMNPTNLIEYNAMVDTFKEEKPYLRILFNITEIGEE